MTQEDNTRISALRGEIDGYTSALIQHEQISTPVLKEINNISVPIELKKLRLRMKENNISSYNTNQLETVYSQTILEPWTFLWHEKKITIHSDYEIYSVVINKWESVYDTVYNLEPDKRSVTVTIISKWLRGLQTIITLYSLRKIRYADEIAVLTQEVKKLKEEIKELELKMRLLYTRYAGKDKQIDALLRYIEVREKTIENLSKQLIPFEEALSRLL